MRGILPRILKDSWNHSTRRNDIAVTYFNRTVNVGDLLTPYLVHKLSGRKVFRAETKIFPSLLAVGSILGSATRHSIIWGSGSMDGRRLNVQLRPEQIYAVRGKMTLNLLQSSMKGELDVPLGDPALLMPRFFNPTVKQRFEIGLIPHYADLKLVRKMVAEFEINAEIIDVQSQPEFFIKKMLECRNVVSSSLHGLILADAYKIPNVWAKFSDNLAGGYYKFNDYYSVTDVQDPEPIEINSPEDLSKLVKEIHLLSRVANCKASLDRLMDAFPLKS